MQGGRLVVPTPGVVIADEVASPVVPIEPAGVVVSGAGPAVVVLRPDVAVGDAVVEPIVEPDVVEPDVVPTDPRYRRGVAAAPEPRQCRAIIQRRADRRSGPRCVGVRASACNGHPQRPITSAVTSRRVPTFECNPDGGHASRPPGPAAVRTTKDSDCRETALRKGRIPARKLLTPGLVWFFLIRVQIQVDYPLGRQVGPRVACEVSGVTRWLGRIVSAGGELS